MKLRLISLLSIMVIVLALSCQSDEQVEFNRYYSGGNQLYQLHCQNCHGEKGEGMQLLIPPLTDSIYLKNNKGSLACYIKNGLQGKITINGREFDDKMLPDSLSPMETAKVLTYITNSFGNKMGIISLQTVETDLKNCR